MMSFPRENLIRMSKDIEVRSDDNGRRTLTGYPILFDEWTTISGWEGNFRERIAPSALTKTLAERGDKVKVLFNHGFDPQIGEKPLGKPSVMEPRDKGLYAETPLADTSYNKDLEALVDAGALDGQSFRFAVIADEWENLDAEDGSLPERTITELRLYEFGPVTFPAYEATTLGVRSRSEYEDYRARLQHLETSLAATIPETGNVDGVIESEAARGTSADVEPTTGHSVSKQKIAALLRQITKVQKGVV